MAEAAYALESQGADQVSSYTNTGVVPPQITPKVEVEDNFTPPTSADLTQPYQKELTGAGGSGPPQQLMPNVPLPGLHPQQLMSNVHQPSLHPPVYFQPQAGPQPRMLQEQNIPAAAFTQSHNVHQEEQYRYMPMCLYPPPQINGYPVANYYPSVGMFQNPVPSSQAIRPFIPMNCPPHNEDFGNRLQNAHQLKSPILLASDSPIHLIIPSADLGRETNGACSNRNHQNCITEGSVTTGASASHSTDTDNRGSRCTNTFPLVVLNRVGNKTATPKKRGRRSKSETQSSNAISSPRSCGRTRKSNPHPATKSGVRKRNSDPQSSSRSSLPDISCCTSRLCNNIQLMENNDDCRKSDRLSQRRKNQRHGEFAMEHEPRVQAMSENLDLHGELEKRGLDKTATKAVLKLN